MPANSAQRILVIGDNDHQVESAIHNAAPAASVTSVGGMFDGIDELTRGAYNLVLAAAEPIERRPEAAVRTLRELVGRGRLLLFGHPTLEPLSRKMLEFGVDDYIVTPANPNELQQIFGNPVMKVVGADDQGQPAPPDEAPPLARPAAAAVEPVATLLNQPLAEILFEALEEMPRRAYDHAIARLNALIGPVMKLTSLAPTVAAPVPADGAMTLSHGVWVKDVERAQLHLSIPREGDQTTARHFVAQLAHLLARLLVLQERHAGLEQLAITDDLTGLYNGRYFKHVLRRLCDDATKKISLVTLLMFDIDNFKKYNDQYGHTLGDEILRQTAALMRRSCRQQDWVFRIAGDEFAVIFVEKEGPRQPHDPHAAGGGRVPASIKTILARFQRSITNPEFAMLGANGQGILTISGGMAIFPHHAHTPEQLVEAADQALMFCAKRSGKNSIHLVGGESADA